MLWIAPTVYPKKYAHGFVVLCFVVVMQSFIMNSHDVFIHIHQGCFAGTEAIVRLPQCQWSKPDGYGEISQCITTTKHSKAKTVCIFLGIYCKSNFAASVQATILYNGLKIILLKLFPNLQGSNELKCLWCASSDICMFHMQLATKWPQTNKRPYYCKTQLMSYE